MAFASVGLDHTSCPVAIRERCAIAADLLAPTIASLADDPAIDEAVVVSTCARAEIYLHSESSIAAACDAAVETLTRGESDIRAYVRILRDTDAVRHLFRVACGLESQVVGEQQIAGQVREAFEAARQVGTVGPNLDLLFRSAIQCSRRVRATSELSRANLSVASAALMVMREHIDVTQADVLVLGSGHIARLLTDGLRNARRLAIASRTLASAKDAAVSCAADALPLDEALLRLPEFDVVFCATRSTRPIITAAHAHAAGPLLMFDLSVPRNVEPCVDTTPGITVYDVDSIATGESAYERDILRIQNVIDSEVRDFIGRHLTRRVAPIIAGLRRHVDHVRELEVARIAAHLDGMDPYQRSAVETLTQRLIDKMFHHLVIRLKLAALTNPAYVDAAEFFFAHGDDTLFPTERTPTDAVRRAAPSRRGDQEAAASD